MLWTAESLAFTQRALVIFLAHAETQRRGKGTEEEATYNI